jgi:hypothetical protein
MRNIVATRRNALTAVHLVNSLSGSPNTALVANLSTTISSFAGLTDGTQNWGNGESAILTAVLNGSLSNLRKNGTESANADSGANGSAGIRIGSFNGSISFFAADVYEFAFFADAQALPLERDQGRYYGITVA